MLLRIWDLNTLCAIFLFVDKQNDDDETVNLYTAIRLRRLFLTEKKTCLVWPKVLL